MATWSSTISTTGFMFQNLNNTLSHGFRFGYNTTLNRPYNSAMVFSGCQIPQGAVITSATLQVNQVGITGSGPFGAISGFIGKSTNISITNEILMSAPRTMNQTNISADLGVRSLDVKSIIEEVVSQPTWMDGDDIVILTKPHNVTSASGVQYYSGPDNVPSYTETTLHVEYTIVLHDLVLSKYSVENTRPNGYEIGNITNKAPGSTISLIGNTSGGLLSYNASTNTVYVSGDISGLVGSYTLTFEETLTDALGSPKTTNVVIDIVNQSSVPTIVASSYTSGINQDFIVPPHQAGDTIILLAECLNTTSATIPNPTITGWTKVSSATVTWIYGSVLGVSDNVFYKKATVDQTSSTTETISAVGVSITGLVVIRDGGDVTVTSSPHGSTGPITWPVSNAPAGSLVLYGATIAGGASPTTWPSVTPSGTEFISGTANISSGNTAGMARATNDIHSQVKSIGVDGEWSAFTINIGGSGPASLDSLTIDNNDLYINSPIDTLVGEISGKTDGSSIEIVGDTRFKVIGNKIYTNHVFINPGSLIINLKETLSGAANSPNSTPITINVLEEPILRYLGGGERTVGVPEGLLPTDIALYFAYRDGSATAAGLPEGFTNITTTGVSSQNGRLCWRYVGTDFEATPSANATTSVLAFYRPKTNYTVTPGSFMPRTATTAIVVYRGLTDMNPNNLSWVVGFVGHRSINTAIATPPDGMINRFSVRDTVDEVAVHDTDGSVSSWSEKTITAGGTNSGWSTIVLELSVSLNVPPNKRRFSYWL